MSKLSSDILAEKQAQLSSIRSRMCQYITTPSTLERYSLSQRIDEDLISLSLWLKSLEPPKPASAAGLCDQPPDPPYTGQTATSQLL